MKIVSVFFLAIGAVVLFSCNNATPKKTEVEVPKELTFEETVRKDTEKYCACAKPLNDFVAKANVQELDSAGFTQYQMLQEGFKQCFDPTGEIAAFGKSLPPEKKKKQIELFNKYRQEICPDVIPKN